MRTSIARLLIAMPAAALLASAALANPAKELAGRWSGSGQITLKGGGTEAVRCVATYQVSGGGSSVRQALRCASASYKIDAIANFSISGGTVSGEWQEQTYSTSGRISGRVTASGFNLTLSGPTFAASMQVSSSGCRQSIFITPSGLDVARISIGLGRC
jgi:hypothetical protein